MDKLVTGCMTCSEFMKTLLQRFTRWHNRRTKRCGNLWEDTFKSGARGMRGRAAGAADLLWTARDLRQGIE